MPKLFNNHFQVNETSHEIGSIFTIVKYKLVETKTSLLLHFLCFINNIRYNYINNSFFENYYFI